MMSGFVCSNSVMAAASPVRAAACKGVVAPRGAESLAAGRRLWAVFFLKARFFGAIAAMYRALALLDRIGGKMPLWGLAGPRVCRAANHWTGRVHRCVDGVKMAF